jgi:polyisoprenoid-binding protein YceI
MSTVAEATKTVWGLDPSHSEITFKVRHMMVTNVTGKFEDFSVDADIDEDDFTQSQVSFSAKTASIETGAADRDKHLRSGDFFDAENHPEMTFVSTSIEKVDGDNYKMTGTLSIRGTEKAVTLDVEVGGFGQDPWGNTKGGFTIKGKINRKDWGLNWNAALEAGGVLVADEVNINCEIQLMKQA